MKMYKKLNTDKFSRLYSKNFLDKLSNKYIIHKVKDIEKRQRHMKDINNYHMKWYMQSCWAKTVHFNVSFLVSFLPGRTFVSGNVRLIVSKCICTCGHFYEESDVCNIYTDPCHKKLRFSPVAPWIHEF